MIVSYNIKIPFSKNRKEKIAPYHRRLPSDQICSTYFN